MISAAELVKRLEWSLIPAVPVPFRGAELDEPAQRGYARWMAAQPVAGVAVWAHTGRGPHLSAEQRRLVLETWREALPDRVVVAGARDITMAIEARRGRADAILVFPTARIPSAITSGSAASSRSSRSGCTRRPAAFPTTTRR